MKELKSIIDTYNKIDFEKHQAAIATVVRVEGSSYRRSGARMLMIDDGRWTGAISGGCLEGDALRKARQAILNGRPSLVTYDTMTDKDAMSLGVGLGCNGIIDVLIEPVNAQDPVQIKFLNDIVLNEKPAVLATVFISSNEDKIRVGKQWMLNEEGPVGDEFKNSDDVKHSNLLSKVVADMEVVYNQGTSLNFNYELNDGTTLTVFIEYLKPSIHLVIFGGGFDAVPLQSFAKNLGWKVTVTDDCVAHIAPARFPLADSLLPASRNEVVIKLNINNYTAAVLLSHNYKYDYAVFSDLIETDIPYIGILGPKKKFQKMIEQLENEGVSIKKEILEKIHAPIGLDIGAELPEEIAISIIAEIQAKFNNAKGEMLKHKEGPIHKRAEEPRHSFNF